MSTYTYYLSHFLNAADKRNDYINSQNIYFVLFFYLFRLANDIPLYRVYNAIIDCIKDVFYVRIIFSDNEIFVNKSDNNELQFLLIILRQFLFFFQRYGEKYFFCKYAVF